MAWTAVANSIRGQAAAARAGSRTLAASRTVIYHNALAAGITRAFLAAAGIALAALVITVIVIRVRREDLAGAAAAAAVEQPPAPSPRWSKHVHDGRTRAAARRAVGTRAGGRARTGPGP